MQEEIACINYSLRIVAAQYIDYCVHQQFMNNLKASSSQLGNSLKSSSIERRTLKHRTQLIQALSTSKQDKCTHKFTSILRSQDLFGEHVEFTYKGKRSYQTTIGAVVSLLVKVILTIFIIYEFYVIFSRKHPGVSVKRIMLAGSLDPKVHLHGWNPRDRGFDVAFQLLTRQSEAQNVQDNSSSSENGNQTSTNEGGRRLSSYGRYLEQSEEGVHWVADTEPEWTPSELDPTYGSVTARLEKAHITEDGVKHSQYVNLQVSRCTNQPNENSLADVDNFKMITANMKQAAKLETAYCIDQSQSVDMTLEGLQHSEEQVFISFRLEQCKNETLLNTSIVCRGQDEIDTYFNDAQAQLSYVNSNFNFKEFDKDPIQYYLDQSITFSLNSVQEQEVTLYLMEGKTELIDHYFKYWEKLIEYFFTIETVKMKSYNFNVKTKVMASVKMRLDSKYIVYGRLADTIFSGLETIGGFYESLIHIGMVVVFFFQERLFKSSFLRQLYQVDAEKIPPKVKIPPSDEMVEQVEKNGEVQEQYLKSILDFLLLRTRLQYGYQEIFHYLFYCRCLGTKRGTDTSPLDKRQVLYARGNEKLERELDVINLIKATRQLRLMSQFLLTKEERTLLKFQRKNVIETTSSESDSDHHTYDTVKLLDSKKDLVKLRQAVKIKKQLNLYKGRKLEDIDKNLLKGLFQRRQNKRFVEDESVAAVDTPKQGDTPSKKGGAIARREEKQRKNEVMRSGGNTIQQKESSIQQSSQENFNQASRKNVVHPHQELRGGPRDPGHQDTLINTEREPQPNFDDEEAPSQNDFGNQSSKRLLQEIDSAGPKKTISQDMAQTRLPKVSAERAPLRNNLMDAVPESEQEQKKPKKKKEYNPMQEDEESGV
ncbi:hypothetical protein FGO68_gene3547 [Halteria grandinella]|uniref:Uncharacterized protein n=1 Tax=Halteria grandinella TaxID=5974 RepID=A0A8J8P162_HALGN|nr:hypothetical protein FGO68_gene3547 [Halteria grandinella]